MAVRKINNHWYVDMRFNGKRYRRKSPIDSKTGAKAYEISLHNKMIRGEPLFEDTKDDKELNISFKEFARKWFEVYVKNNNKPSEIRTKHYILETNLIPFFKETPVHKISNLQIEQYKAKKIAQKLSNKTINNHLTVLLKCLNTAKEWHDIDIQLKIKKLKIAQQQYEFFTKEEAKFVLKNTYGILHEMILVCLKTGVRFGELKGLRWEDINWETRELNVCRSIYRNSVGSTKGNKSRKIPLVSDVCSSLGVRRKKAGYIFLDKKNETLKDTTCKYWMTQAYKKIGVKKIGWHILRHTFASHLAMAGAPIKAIQELLGHSDIQTTMRYAHLTPSTLREAINLLEPGNSNRNFGQYMGNEQKNFNKIIETIAASNPEFHSKVKQKQDP
jgi:integrase